LGASRSIASAESEANRLFLYGLRAAEILMESLLHEGELNNPPETHKAGAGEKVPVLRIKMSR
jgi:hypothetical protein